MKKPVSVMWESTIACGLACKHCKASAKKERDPNELSTEESFMFIDQIKDFGKPYPILRITGGNALMRDDIFEIIKYAKENGIKTTIAPSTTPLLNRENIEKLKKADIDAVAVSIDGHNAELHDSFRGVKGTFEMLIKATRIMKELGVTFRLLTTVTKFNVKYLPEIFILSKKLGAEGWYTYMLIPTGRARIEYEISPQEYEDVFNFIYDLMQLRIMKVNAVAGSEPFRRVAIMRKLVEEGELKKEALKLGSLYYYLKSKLEKLLEKESFEKVDIEYRKRDKKIFGKGIFVAHKGEVYPSSFLPIEIGNVRENSLKKIYRTSKVLRDLHDASKLKGKCRICEFNDVCRGSRSRAYAVYGDYLAEDPYCAYEPGSLEKFTVKKERRAYEEKQKVLDELKITNYSRNI